MSKLATLKMFERMDADEHFETAKKIASDNMASPNYTCSTLLEDQHDHSIKSFIIDLLIKENESTFWSCKLAIIEKEQKQKKLINANKILSEKRYCKNNSSFIEQILQEKETNKEIKRTLTFKNSNL